MSGASTDTGGNVGGEDHIDRAVAELPLQPRKSAADEIVEGLPIVPQVHFPHLETHQIDHVGNELRHLPRLGIDGPGEFRVLLGVRPLDRVAESAARLGDRRERSAQVVRNGREQGIAQTFRFDRDASRLGLFGPFRPFDRQRDLPGKRLEQLTLFREQQAAPLGGLHGEHSEGLLRPLER